MSDIVKRLREFDYGYVEDGVFLEEAAAEIERLRAENKEQQASIQHLLDLLATDRAARILQGKDIAELSAERDKIASDNDWLRKTLKEVTDHSDTVEAKVLEFTKARVQTGKLIAEMMKALARIAKAEIPGVIPDGFTQSQWVLKHHQELKDIARATLEAKDD